MTAVRVKSVVSNPVEKSDGSALPFLGLEDLESRTGRLLRDQLPLKEADDSVRHRNGDVLFSKLRPYLAKSFLPQSPGTATGELLVLRPGPQVDERFLFYVTLSSSWVEWANTTAYGTKMPRTSWELVGEYRMWLPSRDKQRRITDYLDAETARIDALIDRYIGLRDLVAERRQSIIDTVIDEEGTMTPLRYIVRFREGPGIMADDFHLEGVPLIRIAGLQDGRVTLKGCNFLDPQKVAARWAKFQLKLGDRILSGSATMGGVSVVDDPEVVGSIPYTGLIILRAARPDVDMRYVEAFLRSSSFTRQMDVLKTGATMQHFGPLHLSQIKAPLPSQRQQEAAIERVDEAHRQERRITAVVDRQVELLTERRQALITAAVTGQFDVTTASGRGIED
ncbi:hypothetical protein ACWIGG_00995 [Micromonospora aurantiaca (nom. illeg.)]